MIASVRRMEEQDWALARALRLRALAESPDAFAATLAEESGFDDALWQARARSNAERRTTAGFFALCDGVEVGLVVGVRTGDDVELNAMWVAPEARRSGAGRALVEAVTEWASEIGARGLTLEVTLTSQAAQALYRALGFEIAATARTCGSRRAPALRMRRPLL